MKRRLKKGDFAGNPEEQILRLKVMLSGSRPQIWRRIEVPASFTLGDFHFALQISMGWENCHLHLFEVGDRQFSIPMDDVEGSEDEDADGVTFADLGLNQTGKKFRYIYDFGDDWLHDIEVESVLSRKRGVAYPRCTKAVRACPPEDSGGIRGYTQLLRILKNPGHAEYEEYLEWFGDDFDPKNVDEIEINEDLRETFSAV